MSDAIQAETVELGRIHDRTWLAKLTKFERLHRDYLAAQAAYADPDQPKIQRRSPGFAGVAVAV